MYKKILVPLDGSKLAEQVFPPVSQLAQAFSSEVVIIQVCEPEESEYGQTCRLYVNNETERMKNSLAGSTASTRAVVLEGRPDEQILKYAHQNNTSLIFICSHGRSGIAPWALGSTATKVLQKTNTPVIMCKARETPDLTLFRRILLPLDGSETGAKALDYVVELTSKLESEVTILQVVEAGKQVHTFGGLDYIYFKDHDVATMKVKAREYLNTASSRFNGTKASVKVEVRAGDAAREVIKLANETDVSLIALSSHGHSSLPAWFSGSVTYKIIQASQRSVMLVPSWE